MKIELKQWLNDVFSVVKKHGIKLICASITRSFLATLASSAAFALTINYTYWNLLAATIAYLLIWSALESGFLKMILCASRGQKVSFSQLFSGLNLTPLFFILVATYFLATLFGIIAFVVPGMFICVRFSAAGLLFVDKKMSLIDSLKSSMKLTLGYSRLIAPLFLIAITFYFTASPFHFIIELLATIALVVLYLRMTESIEVQS